MIVRNAAFASLGLLLLVGCTSFQEITVETPIQAKLDVSQFQRVLVVGFIAGGSEDVDANLETVRLLRNQLRNKSGLKVIETDVLPLTEIALQQAKESAKEGLAPVAPVDGAAAPAPAAQAADKPQAAMTLPTKIRDEKDLQAYDQIFANVGFWKKLGEEFQNPLIVTGTVLFTPLTRSGYVNKTQEVLDPMGVRQTESVRTFQNRKGFQLKPKFVFIDGRTGTTIHSETFLEETLYNQDQNTPPLSSYFELMDRLIPRFLSTLSSQKIRGTRVLLK